MRKLLALFFLLIAGGLALAGTLQETTFKSMGHKDFYINDYNTFNCAEYGLAYPKDANADYFPVVSLKVLYLPTASGAPVIDTYLNGEGQALAEFYPQDTQDGVARVVLPRERMGEMNTLKVCGKAAPGNGIWITGDSTYGLYSMPYFPKGKGLVVGVETYAPIVGVPFGIVATAKNYGSEDAAVSLSYRRLDLKEALPEASVLDGETSKTGVVAKCGQWNGLQCTSPGELKISYKVVANKGVPMTLLPAVMVYNDVFGQETIVSNRPDIGALDANTVTAQILLENDRANSGTRIPVRILVKNTGPVTRDIKVTLRTGLEVYGNDTGHVDELDEGQTKELEFEAGAEQPGNYELGCTLEYEGKQAECLSTNILLQPPVFSAELIGAGLLTIAGLAVFAYFYYFKKDKA